MAVYIIDYSDPAKTSFTVAPGTIDGPNQSNQHTDLSLPGSGVLEYGELVDENFVKLLENFASPENALLPGTPDPAIISNPIEGQLWFNNTTGVLFHYDGTEWKKLSGVAVGPVAPTGPDQGDLWYDTNIPQLKVFGGATWDSVAARYVEKSGDTMSGFLHWDDGHSSIRAHDGYGNFQMAAGFTSTELGDASNNAYHATSDAAVRWAINYEDVTLGGGPPYAMLSVYPRAQDVGKVAGDEVDPADGKQYIFTDSYIAVDDVNIRDVADPVNLQDAATKKYVDNAIGTAAHLEISGGTMTGFLTLNGAPVNPLHAATKQYVDDEIGALGGGGSGASFAVINPGAGSEKDGDIRVSGSVIEIRYSSIWRQVYPAVYT